MRILVTGSAGHLGEALMRSLPQSTADAVGLDVKGSAFTNRVGSITERHFVRKCVQNVDVVVHTATLHKPHIATHSPQDFVDTNITGTLNLLEEAASAGAKCFIFTSTTSVFGRALIPDHGAAAAWITESVTPIPKNIYGITKLAAEHLCEWVHRETGLPCIILRTSRFFPEEDDDLSARQAYDQDNLKINEFLYRRIDLADVVSAHLCAARKAPIIGFDRFIISATTPFTHDDLRLLRVDAPGVVKRRVPAYESEYLRRGWSMTPAIDRVYVNDRARTALDWQPTYDFEHIVQCLGRPEDYGSPLARAVGSKGYHSSRFTEGPYPIAARRERD